MAILSENKGNNRRRIIIIAAGIGIVIAAAVITILLFVNHNKSTEKVIGGITGADYLDKTLSDEVRAQDLLSRMSLEEKIGQMVVVKQSGLAKKDIQKKYLSGVLNDNVFSKETDICDMGDDLKAEAQKTKLAIPIFYGAYTDNETLSHISSTLYPSHSALGAARNSSFIRNFGSDTAFSMLKAGFNWSVNNVGTVVYDTSQTGTEKYFAQNAYQNGSFIVEYLNGMSDNQTGEKLVMSVSGYLGKGFSKSGNANLTIPDSEEYKGFLFAYEQSVEAGAKMIFAADSQINSEACASNSFLLTEVLKGELEFQGIVAADEKALAVAGDQAVRNCINAGVDMLVLDQENGQIDSIVQFVKNNEITQERIDDAIRRILMVKFSSGLFENIYSRDYSEAEETNNKFVRMAVRDSSVLIKNDNNVLEQLPDMKSVLVVGKSADSIAASCGISDSAGELVKGLTILGGLQEVSKNKIEYSEQAIDAKGYDAAIIVVEAAKQDAENNSYIDQNDLNTLTSMRQMNAQLPVVLVILTDRPLAVSQALEKTDGCIIAWRPGTEGAGIADILLTNNQFAGIMPCSWPKTAGDLPVYPGNEKNTAFKYGFSLKKQLD